MSETSRTPIHDYLVNYADVCENSNIQRCHTPGHKGVINPLDITEIDIQAINIIKKSERITADLFRAERTLFSCSGSTLAINAMLAFCEGKRVTAMRGTHRSFIDSAILLGFDVDWFLPSDICNLDKYVTPDTAAVFVTSIDYYGNVCDIKAVSAVTERLGVPLLVDNAHGAYLVFTDTHPINLGAAMVADSAHKTLPALTGAAYLHIANTADSTANSAVDAMSLFGTSSPSYLILDSLDLCNEHIADEKHKATAAFNAVAELKRNLIETGYTLNKSDLLRVVADVSAYGYNGGEFAELLRSNGIVCEMCDNRYIILLFSTITKKENTKKVFKVMKSIPPKIAFSPLVEYTPFLCEKLLSPRAAYFSNKHSVPVQDAIGGICGGIHVTTPPCVPPVIPGEVITRNVADLLIHGGINHIDILD